MHVTELGEREWLVVLEKDEPVNETLVEFAREKGIQGGWTNGLGSVKEIELGYYDLPKRTYLRREFDDDMELTGFLGNFAMDGDEPVLHAHAALSGPELIAFAGHLFSAVTAVTAEFWVRDFGRRLERHAVTEIGLKLIRPCPVPAADAGSPDRGEGGAS